MLALWSALAGCECDDTLVVRGGSMELRAVVGEALDEWRALGAPARVCSVTLVADAAGSRDAWGSYNTATRKVEVALAAPDPARILRHELCHAMDLQNDLRKASDQTWWIDPDRPAPPSHEDAEAFAQWCELGPALELSDRPEAQTMLALAWPSAIRDALPLSRDQTGHFSAPHGEFLGGGITFDDRGNFRISSNVAGTRELHDYFLDAVQCMETTEFGPLDLLAVEGPPVPPPTGWTVWGGAHTSDGRFLTVGSLPLPDGSVSRPWLVLDADEWWRGDDGGVGTLARGVGEAQREPVGVEGRGSDVTCFRWEL